MTHTELRQLLADTDTSQRELGRRLDVDYRHINKLCGDKAPITTAMAKAIRCELGACPHVKHKK